MRCRASGPEGVRWCSLHSSCKRKGASEFGGHTRGCMAGLGGGYTGIARHIVGGQALGQWSGWYLARWRVGGGGGVQHGK